MSQTISEPDAETAGRWEDGRWVEPERLAEEPDEPVVEPVAEETGDKLLIPVLWERSAYAALFVGALIMRLWDLGARAVHHDESLHGFFAWQIFNGNVDTNITR